VNKKRSLKLNKNDMGQKEELDWTCCRGDVLMKLALGGRMEGKQPRGRPRMGMILKPRTCL